MKTKPLLLTFAILTVAMSIAAQEAGTFIDARDNRTYKTVVIGAQTWMAENLAYKADSGCFAYKNDTNNLKIYGYLYRWETAKSSCPSGWHLPSDEEWAALIDTLGGGAVASNKLKEEGTKHWVSSDNDVTNEAGFTAIPGGTLGANNSYYSIGSNCGMWSSTEYDPKSAWYRNINYKYNVSRIKSNKASGFSVRCIMDKGTNGQNLQRKTNKR